MKKIMVTLLLAFVMLVGGFGNVYSHTNYYPMSCNLCHMASGGDSPHDTQPPVVVDFSCPSTWDSLTVPITTLTVSDIFSPLQGIEYPGGLTQYMIGESSSAPSASSSSWSSTPPVDYVFATPGMKTLYAWAKDGAGNVSEPLSAVVEIILPTVNAPPVADAGPDQSVFVLDEVTLDAGGSTDQDKDPLTYFWSFDNWPQGSSATLSDPSAVSPHFRVDEPGTYVFTLIVNDGFVDSDPDMVIISTENSTPVANAGKDQTAVVGDTVTLDGSGSTDVDGDPLTYTWSLSVPEGSSATLEDADTMSPTFIADITGDYVAQLIVNDGFVDSDPDTVVISMENSTPVADAGEDQTAVVGDTVTLDGSGSTDVDGDPLTYTWSLSVPDGSGATLSDPTAMTPTFTVDVSGDYVAQLIVNDGFVDSDPDTVVVSTGNSTPVADAGGDQTAVVGDTVTLDGSGSTGMNVAGETVRLDGSRSATMNNTSLTFKWSLISVPGDSSATLSDPAAMNPTFYVDAPGDYVAQLIVNDGTVDSDPDTSVVKAALVNDPPPDSNECREYLHRLERLDRFQERYAGRRGPKSEKKVEQLEAKTERLLSEYQACLEGVDVSNVPDDDDDHEDESDSESEIDID